MSDLGKSRHGIPDVVMIKIDKYVDSLAPEIEPKVAGEIDEFQNKTIDKLEDMVVDAFRSLFDRKDSSGSRSLGDSPPDEYGVGGLPFANEIVALTQSFSKIADGASDDIRQIFDLTEGSNRGGGGDQERSRGGGGGGGGSDSFREGAKGFLNLAINAVKEHQGSSGGGGQSPIFLDGLLGVLSNTIKDTSRDPEGKARMISPEIKDKIGAILRQQHAPLAAHGGFSGVISNKLSTGLAKVHREVRLEFRKVLGVIEKNLFEALPDEVQGPLEKILGGNPFDPSLDDQASSAASRDRGGGGSLGDEIKAKLVRKIRDLVRKVQDSLRQNVLMVVNGGHRRFERASWVFVQTNVEAKVQRFLPEVRIHVPDDIGKRGCRRRPAQDPAGHAEWRRRRRLGPWQTLREPGPAPTGRWRWRCRILVLQPAAAAAIVSAASNSGIWRPAAAPAAVLQQQPVPATSLIGTDGGRRDTELDFWQIRSPQGCR
ncbi:hypothetical protein MAPG_11674 [Magnaporthiopsis poae ATCC 64411]|uniref:Uncharacterized protein n=1 Tax=Magnaporthiopsis poae (strain ATCC 64411 / 73-15) TaxID=644358 RepID=A0A0C4EFW5_MAGP6|nr:hypothetical protein MAPG_11674 [Magnaporthiopsis poae ATCC 64411]